jgi:hypothetical protein
MTWKGNYVEGAILLLIPLVLSLGCQSTSQADLGEYDASMTVKRVAVAEHQAAQYLVEMLVWQQRADGRRAILSEPQVVVLEGAEAEIVIGGSSDADPQMRCNVIVKESNGKKIGTAIVEYFEDGATVWQKKLETEAVPAPD